MLSVCQANKVVIFDPAWSMSSTLLRFDSGAIGTLIESLDPAHDLQAMDRAFRIGQKRPVYVSDASDSD